ncbi:hypothetical protein [Bacillus cereus]|uniref:hypothetical protein n=1 Tax=Bacillus cereus TaxID=1396 RepID=UPI00032E8719|nr:hypothetical protein [Bacillus cereus]EOO20277.1 hypothetical protein IG9_00460 [Bacillus cereus HuA2-9]
MEKQELNELKRNRTIPIFDCLYEIDEHLEFYTALGFDITYYQKAPYRFASVKNEFTELSFFGDKNFDIEQKHGGCYIVVSNIDDVYNILKTNLKKYYGKIPMKGVPRISRLNTTVEDRRCNITDPSGNTLIIGEPLGDSTLLISEENKQTKAASKFEKIYKLAYKYAYSKEDFLAASNLLESVFNKQCDSVSNELYFKAKVVQIDVLVTLNRQEKATKIIRELESIQLTLNEKRNVENETQHLLEIKDEILLVV